MKKIGFIILIIFIFGFTVVQASENKIKVTLVKCVDGDTAVFNLNGEETKFRFLAIDTPESVHPTKSVQAYGKEASTYTCEILENAENIYVEYDEKGSKTDKYGRNLAWIWVDDSLLQSILVRNGYATVAYIYYKYSYVPDLCATQELAINEKLNIWSEDRDVGYCSTINYSDSTAFDTKVYTVTFKNGDEEVTKSVIAGDTITKPDDPSKDGYGFIGWYLNGSKFDFSSKIDSDITLEAKYEINYYYFAYAAVVLIVCYILKMGKRKKR